MSIFLFPALYVCLVKAVLKDLGEADLLHYTLYA